METGSIIAFASLAVAALMAAVAITNALFARRTRHDDGDERKAEELAGMQRTLDRIDGRTVGMASDVADIKADQRVHAAQITELSRQMSATETLARSAMDNAKIANERLDFAGAPSAYAARIGRNAPRWEQVEEGKESQ